MPDRPNEEWLFVLRGAVGELQLRRIVSLIARHGFGVATALGLNRSVCFHQFRLKTLDLASGVVLGLRACLTGVRSHINLQIRRARSSFFVEQEDRKSTRLNSSHLGISYAVFCLKK